MHPAISILITLACLGGIILLSSLGVKSGKLSGEMARKAVHVGMGLLCLCFPWLFDSILAVQVMAGIAILTLLVVRLTKLRRSLGPALFSVERLSIGELLFPLAVAWLFTIGWDKPILYAIALLLLTLADTAGALAGTRYGKKMYQTTAATKSLEGSLAFFVTAFLCIALPLYFFADLSIGLILFLSLTISLFTMAVEGASGHGLDNLLIPLGAYLLLDYYIGLEDHVIFLRSVVLMALLGLLLATHRKHTFDGGAILTAMLFGFSAFTLGGVPCLLAALMLFARHIMAQHRMPAEYVVTHSIDVIIVIAIPSLFWLTLGRGEIIDYPVAQFGFICTLSLVIYMLHTGTQKHMYREKASLLTGFILSLAVLAPALMLDIAPVHYLPTILLGLPLARFYFYWRSGPDDQVYSHWLQLGILAAIFSIVAMLPVVL
ncbi:MAG: hypothetical protein H7A51_02045 [Akkermansiaceae bacterium]|nr:hypothetical protein [Akkermansiaceae bacterium]